MKLLEERIRKDGIVKPGNVLKVDSFLNHQMDIELFSEMGKEFDVEKRSELGIQMQQTVLDDHAFVFCSFLKMSMISKANVTGYESHACDYYQVTADLDIN